MIGLYVIWYRKCCCWILWRKSFLLLLKCNSFPFHFPHLYIQKVSMTASRAEHFWFGPVLNQNKQPNRFYFFLIFWTEPNRTENRFKPINFGSVRFFNIKTGKTYIQTDRVFFNNLLYSFSSFPLVLPYKVQTLQFQKSNYSTNNKSQTCNNCKQIKYSKEPFHYSKSIFSNHKIISTHYKMVMKETKRPI